MLDFYDFAEQVAKQVRSSFPHDYDFKNNYDMSDDNEILNKLSNSDFAEHLFYYLNKNMEKKMYDFIVIQVIGSTTKETCYTRVFESEDGNYKTLEEAEEAMNIELDLIFGEENI